MDLQFALTAILAGCVVGYVLGLVGGGGSILAVPLLIYLVGVESTHIAIGTAAVAVAINAAIGLFSHARSGNVKWPCALVFALFAIAGAILGAELGKAMDGTRLLVLFALLMLAVGGAGIVKRDAVADPDVHLDRQSAARLLPRLMPTGFGIGGLSGFFGIGGGFLVVPGLTRATAMPVAIAIGSSLVVITAIGTTTALSYALSSLIDWRLVVLLTFGGAFGAFAGQATLKAISLPDRTLQIVFGAIVIAVGLAMLVSEGIGQMP